MTRKRPTNRSRRRKSGDRAHSEYRFDYSKARPNRFVSNATPDAIVVTLDPDVAAVFDSSESVNKMLRSVIAALPHPGKR